MELLYRMKKFYNKLRDHDRKVPLLRGRIYFINYFLHLYVLGDLFNKKMRPETRMSLFVCIITSFASTTISCFYHNKVLDEKSRNVYKRIDYAVIFLLIVTAYFPIYVYFIKDYFSLFYVFAHWFATLTGVFCSLIFNFTYISKWARVASFVSIGLFNNYLTFKLYKVKMFGPMFDVNFASFLYLLAGLVYASKFPNLIPRIFEHHEMVHLIIVIGNFFTFRSNFGIV